MGPSKMAELGQRRVTTPVSAPTVLPDADKAFIEDSVRAREERTVRVPKVARLTTVTVVAAAFFVALAAPPAHADSSKAVDRAAEVAQVVGDIDAVAPVSAAEYAVAREAVGAPLSQQDQASVLALSCWTWTVSVRATNIFGSTLWRYFQRIYWCRDGYRVWYPSVQRRWGEVYWPGWEYKGVIDRWSYGGHGYTYWTVGSQSHFCLIAYFSCVQNRYPWLEQTVRGSGYNTWRYGG